MQIDSDYRLLAINVLTGLGYSCYRYLQDRVEARRSVIRLYPGRLNCEWRSISSSSVVESRALQRRAGRRDRDNQEKGRAGSPHRSRFLTTHVPMDRCWCTTVLLSGS